MKFTPILFRTPMVQGIDKKIKTQTRRVIKPQPSIKMRVGKWIKNKLIQMIGGQEVVIDYMLKNAPYKVGDILWVKETTCYVMLDHAHDLLEGAKDRTQFVYKANVHPDWMEYAKEKYGYKWTPSIYMPKAACRIFLKITNVRAERLQDISEEDAQAEGVAFFEIEGKRSWRNYFDIERWFLNPIESFKTLWQSINGLGSWEANDWVWAISFEKIEKPENFI